MPYSIRLPDGSLVTNIPDEIPLREAARQLIKKGIVAAPETTILGNIAEAGKGLVPGAVNLLESAAIGASALLSDEQEKSARKTISDVAKAVRAPFDPALGYEEAVGRKVGEAVGSMVPMLATVPLGPVGIAGAAALGIGAGAGEARTRAETAGATEEQRATATALGTIPGALEVFAPFRIVKRLPENTVIQGVQYVKRALLAGGEEAAQEAASSFAQNLIAKGVYKPDQALIEGLGESAAYGGAAGAIAQGVLDLALGRRARTAAPAAAPAPGTPPGTPPTTPPGGAEDPIDRLVREAAAQAQAPTAPTTPTAPTAPTTPAAPTAPTAPAAPTTEEQIPEPTVVRPPPGPRRGGEIPETLPTVFDSDFVRTIGFVPTKKATGLHDKLAGRNLEDPKDLAAVKNILGNYLRKREAEGPLTGTGLRVKRVLDRLPPTPTPAPTAATTATAAPATVEPDVVPAAPAAVEPEVPAPVDVTTALKNATREFRLMGTIPDPVAQDLIKSRSLPALTEAISQTGVTQVNGVLGAGVGSIVLDTDKGALRLGLGEATKVPVSSNVIQPIASGNVGGLRFELMPKAETGTATEADIDALEARLESEGLKFSDRGLDNVGIVDGRLVVIDPGAIAKITPSPAAPSAPAAAATPTQPPPAPFIGASNVDSTQPTGTGESVPVAGEPGAVTPARKPRTPEPSGVVPASEDAERTDGGERAQPSPVTRGKFEPPLREGLAPARVESLRAKLAEQRARIRSLEAQRDEAERNLNVAEATGNEGDKAAAIDAHEKARSELKKVVASSERTYWQLYDKNKAELEGDIGEAYVESLKAEARAAQRPAYPYNLTSASAVREEVEYQVPHNRDEYKEYIEKYFTSDRKLRRNVSEADAVSDGIRLLEKLSIRFSTPAKEAPAKAVSRKELDGVVAQVRKALGGTLEIEVHEDVTDVFPDQVAGSRAGVFHEGKIHLFRTGIEDGVAGQKTIFHELFHRGLRKLYPKGEFFRLTEKFYNQSPAIRAAADAYLASDVGKADTKGLHPVEQRAVAVDEALAIIAEDTNAKPTALRQVGNFLANVADRIGLPKVARAIRTMGYSPLQKFVQEAVLEGRREGYESGTRFATPGLSPQTRVTAQSVRVIGEQSEDIQKSGQNAAVRTRIEVADSMAGIEAKFFEPFGGKVASSGGILNPTGLLVRALDASRFSEALREYGDFVKRNGLWQVEVTSDVGADGKPLTYQNVRARIANAAKAAETDIDAFTKDVDTLLYAHREYHLNKMNEDLEQQAVALETAAASQTDQKKADKLKSQAAKIREDKVDLLISDPQELQRLENAFQADDFIKGVSNDLDRIRFKQLDTLVESGRISEEQAKEWKDNKGYVPFRRVEQYQQVFGEQSRGSARGPGALRKPKAFKGSSDRESTSVLDNFSYFLDWSVSETMKNDASLHALEMLELIGAAKTVSAASKEGAGLAFDAPGDVVTVYKEGKEAHFYVPDPSLVVGFSIQPPQLNSISKALASVTRVLRAGVTSLPPFAVKQVFDDTQRAYTYAGVKDNAALVRRMMVNFPINWVNEALGRKTKSIQEMERVGVIGSFDIMPHRNLDTTLIKAGAKKEGFWGTALRVMEAGAKASDISLREAIYNQVYKETGSQVLAENAAREIINFSRRGANSAIQWTTAVVPFFNAYAQGMDKLANAAIGPAIGGKTGLNRGMFYRRMVYLTALGFAYALVMMDDEEYMAAPDHERDNNWFLPFTGGLVKIPTPPELAFFYKAIPERVVRYYKNYGTPEEEVALDLLREMFVRGLDVFLSPNVTPVAIKPFVENYVNYSFFLGRPLESPGQLRLEPFERYGVGTTDTAKLMARAIDDFADRTGMEAIKISPIKIENALRGILGSTAGLALSISDAVINPDRTDRPLHQQLGAQLTGASALLRNPAGTNQLDKAYNFEAKVENVFNTYNRILQTRPEDADSYMKAHLGLYTIREPYKALMNDIRELNKQALAIDRMKGISPEERRQMITDLVIAQNDIANQFTVLRRIAREVQRQADAE